MYVKNNKGLIAIIIILAILVIALGVYIFKGESIRQWVSKDVPKTTEENNTNEEKYSLELSKWNSRKEEFKKNQDDFNRSIDEMYEAYQDGDKDATELFYLELLQ